MLQILATPRAWVRIPRFRGDASGRRCVSVDIRPIDARLPGLEVRAGSAAGGEVPFVTTMCVLEHIAIPRDRAAEVLMESD
jgi:hypothetical protein